MDLTPQSAFLAEMSTLLILLAGAVILYSSFHEKYLAPWIAGLSVFTLSKVFLASVLPARPRRCGPLWRMVRMWWRWACLRPPFFLRLPAQTAMAGDCRTQCGPAFGGGLCAVEAVSGPAHCGVCPLLAGEHCGSAQLVRFAWGRVSVGRWLLAAMLVVLHLDTVGSVHQIVGTDILVDLLLGISMMIIVLDDSRIQVQRLDALNTITHQISDSRDFEPTVGTILEELRKITRAKAAWFRILEGEKLTMAAHRGLSQAFVDKVATIETTPKRERPCPAGR